MLEAVSAKKNVSRHLKRGGWGEATHYSLLLSHACKHMHARMQVQIDEYMHMHTHMHKYARARAATHENTHYTCIQEVRQGVKRMKNGRGKTEDATIFYKK